MTKKSIPKSLLKSLNNEYGSIKHVRAIEWGLANESTAVNILQETENIIVQPTGLWLHQCGFIGASPDGLIGEDDIVEVKCPYKYRKCKLSDAITEDQSYIIYKINNEIFINKHHNYWHQIQGQLFMTKRSRCFLVVWTTDETIIVQIYKDTNWSNNFNIIKSFYLEHYIPYILGKNE
ncbi:uncharacterized protein LOC111034395 [Myzus persicae]|uniref:uncharacterized protein LOC111034395 n=1 Tax=Myzus persicae TaxID=13164 RepID=UPI000B932A27|nr:uncharacterized protein LOC111034395 [Myzus persicae]